MSGEEGGVLYYVMLTRKGETQIQGVYSSRDAAQNRADSIEGDGVVEVWGPTYIQNRQEAVQEYRMYAL